LEEGAGDFAGFGEGGAGDEDEAELGIGWHWVRGKIVTDLEFVRERKRKDNAEEGGERGFVAFDRKNPPFAEGTKDGAPSSSSGPGLTTDTRVTVECEDYDCCADCVADQVWD
jgi:hypothetical protein